MKTKLQLRYLIPHVVLLLVGMVFACKKDQPTPGETPTAKPEITSIQPKNPQPGDVVTITGTNFGAAATDVKLTIGSTELTITSITATEIKFTVPQTLSSGTLALAIKGIAATNKDTQGSTITVTPKPTVVPTFTAMSPTSGKAGDVVTLMGTNFNPQASENKVFFTTTTGGTVVLATVKTASATQLTVEVPASAVTGAVSLTISGTNATVAAGFTPTFTVVPPTGTGGGTNVSYINVQSGNLNITKIATSLNEIGEMYYDKYKNMLYYSDYSLLTQSGDKVYKQDPTGNNPAVALTNDARIQHIVKIATDADGNVYTLQYDDKTPSNYNIYKITADGATVTEIKKDLNMSVNTSSNYFFYINAAKEICLRPDYKVTQSGQVVINGGTSLYGLVQAAGGGYFNGSTAYLAQTTNNTSEANKCKFIKWNLADGSVADASFTLQSLFNTDDPTPFSSNNNISKLKFGVDDSENLYAIMDHSYISGQLTKTWMIRKVKNGTAGSTLLGTFNIKFPSLDLTDLLGVVNFVVDSRGNMYIKANQKDILRITY